VKKVKTVLWTGVVRFVLAGVQDCRLKRGRNLDDEKKLVQDNLGVPSKSD
jgi:hypothetical protein